MKPTKLSVIRSDQKRSKAKALRAEMYGHIRDAVRDAGDNFAGYAVVLWDRDGYNWSTLKSGGPVRSRFIPTFASDALNQHVTCDLVADDRRKE